MIGVETIDPEVAADMSDREAAFAAERASRPSPPSDIEQTIQHACNALRCLADMHRWHHGRAALRGLDGGRGARALAGAAARADWLAADLSDLVRAGHEYTESDWTWMSTDFERVHRAREITLAAAEHDWRRIGGRDLGAPEYDQLCELEDAAWSAGKGTRSVATMADIIQFTMVKCPDPHLAKLTALDPREARLRAAEELAALRYTMRGVSI